MTPGPLGLFVQTLPRFRQEGETLGRDLHGLPVQSQRGEEGGMGSVKHVRGVSLVQPGSWHGPKAWESLAGPRRGEDFPSWT